MKYKKYTKVVAAAMLCMICVCGCNGRHPVDEQPIVNENLTQTPSVTLDATPSVQVDELNEQKEISIYTIDSKSYELVSIPAMVDGDKTINPQFIVDKVVESMRDVLLEIGVDSVTTEDETIIVSFLDDQPPVKDVDSSMEQEILNAIAQSLLDNLIEYDKVIFRVMGEGYHSDHITKGIDEVYMQYKR